MRKIVLSASLALALAACGQASTTKAPEAPAAAAADLKTQVLAMPAETQPVFAFQKLVAYQQAHPEAAPLCGSPRETESRGVIAAGLPETSVYAPLAGSAVYSIQCGALRSGTMYDPKEHWLVVFAPGAADVSVVNCALPNGRDNCPRAVPPAVAMAPAPTTTTTP